MTFQSLAIPLFSALCWQIDKASPHIALFGSEVRRHLRPLIASNWSRMTHIGGAYSHALPGRAAARQVLARPFDKRIFFAGEATNATDFSTAHGAHDSGVRAAEVMSVLL